MRSKFIGRSYELQRLGYLLHTQMAHFVVIKGRRRIGKSRLIEEFAKRHKDDIFDFIRFSGMPPTDDMTSQDQRDDFARQMGRIFKIPPPLAQDWGDLFWHLNNHIAQTRLLSTVKKSSQKKSSQKTVLVFDEISWMGMKDPTFLGKLKTAWDTLFKQDSNLILILCGSVSSWIEKNILKNTGFVGRIDLVFTLNELSLPESLDMLGSRSKKLSGREIFKILCVTGGIPRYLELIDLKHSAEENIKNTCFVPEGFLFREFDTIFHDLFSTRSEIYKNILEALLHNPTSSLDDIFVYLNRKKSGVLSDYMEDLIQAGFVTRDHTWNLRNGRPSALSHFRLSDNYVRFYLKYVSPQKSKIEKNFYTEKSLSTLSGWETIMGLQFENLVIRNRKLLLKALRIDPSEVMREGPYFQRATTKKKGCQIDYLIQNQFNSYYPCEIKFSQNPLGPHVAQECAQKMATLDLPKNVSCRPVLIHVNGVEDSLIGEEFFAHIIDFKDMLRE